MADHRKQNVSVLTVASAAKRCRHFTHALASLSIDVFVWTTRGQSGDFWKFLRSEQFKVTGLWTMCSALKVKVLIFFRIIGQIWLHPLCTFTAFGSWKWSKVTYSKAVLSMLEVEEKNLRSPGTGKTLRIWTQPLASQSPNNDFLLYCL